MFVSGLEQSDPFLRHRLIRIMMAICYVEINDIFSLTLTISSSLHGMDGVFDQMGPSDVMVPNGEDSAILRE